MNQTQDSLPPLPAFRSCEREQGSLTCTDPECPNRVDIREAMHLDSDLYKTTNSYHNYYTKRAALERLLELSSSFPAVTSEQVKDSLRRVRPKKLIEQFEAWELDERNGFTLPGIDEIIIINYWSRVNGEFIITCDFIIGGQIHTVSLKCKQRSKGKHWANINVNLCQPIERCNIVYEETSEPVKLDFSLVHEEKWEETLKYPTFEHVKASFERKSEKMIHKNFYDEIGDSLYVDGIGTAVYLEVRADETVMSGEPVYFFRIPFIVGGEIFQLKLFYTPEKYSTLVVEEWGDFTLSSVKPYVHRFDVLEYI